MSRIGDGPIDPALRDMMNAIARAIDDVLNGKGKEKEYGFILMVFPFREHGGLCNYISNAKREDVVVLLREQLARFEGRVTKAGNA